AMSAALDATTTPFSLSVLTATKGHASKKLVPDAHGRPVRDPAHSLAIAAGRIEHIQLAGLAGLHDLLQGTQHHHPLVLGVARESPPGPLFRSPTLKAYARAPDPRPRSLAHIAYPPGPRLLMFDYDPAPEAPETLASADELITRLTEIWPALADAGWL